jgi:ankyrin repeat protein
MGKDEKKKRYIAPAILRYAEHGEIDKVKKELSAGVDINTEDRYGWNVLSRAVSNNHIDLVKYLIDNGAVEKPAVLIKNPIMMIAKTKEMIELLIEKKFDVNSKNSDGETAIFNADIDTLKLLILKRANVNLKKKNDWTPLAEAVIAQDKDVVEELIKAGADVNVYCDGTPIIVLSCKKTDEMAFYSTNPDPAIVKLLIQAGANVNAKEKDYLADTALKKAQINGDKEIVKMLKDAGAK